MRKVLIVLSLILVVFITTTINLSNVGEPIKKLVQSEPTKILPDPIVIVREVQQLAKLETASITFERVLQAKKDQERFWGVFGEKILFVAYGEVVVGVDLKKLQENDIQVVDADTVNIHLPKAEIFNVILDNEKSYVANRDTGILAQTDSQMETEIRKRAQQELKISALGSGILSMADKNAEYGISNLLRELGFKNVVFTDTIPTD